MVLGIPLTPLITWINAVLPNFNMPLEISEEELRACLRDGSVLCTILDKLVPGSLEVVGISFIVLYAQAHILCFFFSPSSYVFINIHCLLIELKSS
jgi:hypothetical protein